jgi:hypothetical protein
MLNMIDTTLLLGQRPSIWWTRFHDIDLIIGSYRYGYANYLKIKEDEQYGFDALEKSCMFNDFPNADTLTRRLKKLVSLIVRHENTYHNFDFDSLDHLDSVLKEYADGEVRDLFDFVKDYGVPVGSDGKSNWIDLRDKFFGYNSKYEQKVPSAVERLVQHFRMMVQSKIYRKMMSKKYWEVFDKVLKERNLNFDISLEEAEEFFRNDSKLRFIRKKILKQKYALFNANKANLKIESDSLPTDHPAKLTMSGYEPAKHDL